MGYSFVLLAAGKGVRLGKETPKQFLPLAGKPMIVHSLERVDALSAVSEVIVVCNDEYVQTIRSYIDKYAVQKPVVFAKGGETRQESVFSGVNAASELDVILHEAARPFVSIEEFEALIACPYDSVTYTYSIPFTVAKKNEEGFVSGILNRDELVNVQLPQKFRRGDLIASHTAAINDHRVYTDDASMMKHYLNKSVHCLAGRASNIKVTEYIDLLFGEILFREKFLEVSIL